MPEVEFIMNHPTYADYCRCLKICKKIGAAYSKCYKDAIVSPTHSRCSIETMLPIMQTHRINNKRRDYIFASIGFVLGSIFTKLLDTFWNDIVCLVKNAFVK